jgi:hypothetical protein
MRQFGLITIKPNHAFSSTRSLRQVIDAVGELGRRCIGLVSRRGSDRYDKR